jgi:hypothetical protein
MPTQILFVLFLTFIIYVISTLAYSVRIVGVKTGRIAISFSVFNIFALISRMAGTIQAPLLAKTVEKNIKAGTAATLLPSFRWILVSATCATIVGAILIPTFIRVFSKAVSSFSVHRSLPKLLLHGFSKAGIEQFRNSVTVPRKGALAVFKEVRKIPKKIMLLNVIVFSISTVGGLAALYAGCVNPDYRSTCTTLSSFITGIATVFMYIFVDPYISMLADDVIQGKCSLLQYKRSIAYIVAGLIIGTTLAQLLLLPAARLISLMAELIPA